MQRSLLDLLRDATFVTVAFGIAIGWALLQVAEGVAQLVSALLTELDADDFSGTGNYGEPLTWRVGNRIVTFGALLGGVVELAVVVWVALLVRQWLRVHSSDAPPQTNGDG